MIRNIISLIAILTLTAGFLIACTEDSPSESEQPSAPTLIFEESPPATEPDQEPVSEPTPEPASEPTQEPTPEATPELTQEATQESTAEPEFPISLSDLVGIWSLSHSVNADGEEGLPVYHDWLIYTLEILSDGSFWWAAYGTLSGDLTQVGDYAFEASNLVATSEGMTWSPEGDIVRITYNPETGLLQFYRGFLWEDGPTADPWRIYYYRD
jgi:hypothetical protein